MKEGRKEAMTRKEGTDERKQRWGKEVRQEGTTEATKADSYGGGRKTGRQEERKEIEKGRMREKSTVGQ